MTACNFIEFEDRCPACARSARIRARTGMSSDYGGDDSGRFCERAYGIGERMAWFDRDDVRYGDWSAAGRKIGATLQEACTAVCAACRTPLVAVIGFRDLRATEVVRLSLDTDWPPGFLR